MANADKPKRLGNWIRAPLTDDQEMTIQAMQNKIGKSAAIPLTCDRQQLVLTALEQLATSLGFRWPPTPPANKRGA